MPTNPSDPRDVKMLPTEQPGSLPAPVTPATSPARQLSDIPRDELHHLAEMFGLDPTHHASRQSLVAALHDRRQMIAGLDRDAMMDVIRWGRRPVTINASKEHLAQEIVRINSMRFSGLSHRGLVALARLRGVNVESADGVPTLVKKLKKQEGFFSRLSRKRRSFIGSIVSNMLGDESEADYQHLPPSSGNASSTTTPPPNAPRSASIKHEIEDAGLFGGIAGRIKRSADSYVNQKLDEIESRIDRKLDEIDRRLAEWRDKEIANRLRILKFTLWATVIVSGVSLIILYIKTYWTS